MHARHPHSHRFARALLLCTFGLMPSFAGATDLSNNLYHVSSGLETEKPSRRIAASFQNGPTATTLESLTLLLGNPVAGTARVDLYSASNLEPGSFVGSLISPPSYTATPTATTFLGNGLTLLASRAYWVVLTVLEGTFSWSWTADNSGAGAGFLHVWGYSNDAGASWYTHDAFATQMAVTIPGACTSLTWYFDLDGDGYGNPASTVQSCVPPVGYTTTGGDCADADAVRFPGNPEYCDGVDNNCDSVVDDVAVPGGAAALAFGEAPGEVLIWAAVPGATAYDVVAGSLAALIATNGNYATAADTSCLANDFGPTSLSTEGVVPVAGAAAWFLVRPVNCDGPGSYDEEAGLQQGSRDAELVTGGLGCP